MKELKKSGYTVIYTTNAIDEILLSDRILILNNTQIAEDFKKVEILDKIDVLKKYDIKIPEIVSSLKNLKDNGFNIKLENWTINELTCKIIGELKK